MYLKCFSSYRASSFSAYNPGLTKLFSPVNLKNKRPRYTYLIPWYSYGSPFSIHTKKSTNIPCMTSQWRHNCRFCKELPIYSEIYTRIEFFTKKVLKIGTSPSFLLIKEGNDVSNIYCKIQAHTKKISFKIVIFIIGANSPHDKRC